MNDQYILPRGRLDVTFENVRIVLCGVMAACTKCQEVKNIEEFGLRTMGDGAIRNQAQCADCRGGS